jgi:hypothetical protein
VTVFYCKVPEYGGQEVFLVVKNELVNWSFWDSVCWYLGYPSYRHSPQSPIPQCRPRRYLITFPTHTNISSILYRCLGMEWNATCQDYASLLVLVTPSTRRTLYLCFVESSKYGIHNNKRKGIRYCMGNCKLNLDTPPMFCSQQSPRYQGEAMAD